MKRAHYSRKKGKVLQQVAALLLVCCPLTNAAPTSIPSPDAPPLLYRLSANDLVNLKVFQEDELETNARVSLSGTVTIPLAGEIRVAGKTLQEAAKAIESALREYINQPRATLRVVEYNKRKFIILGQVNRPGTYSFPDEGNLNLLEGIGLAGGFTRLANPSRITVKRGEQVFRIDGKKMAREQEAPPFSLMPGDTIVISESLF